MIPVVTGRWVLVLMQELKKLDVYSEITYRRQKKEDELGIYEYRDEASRPWWKILQ